MAKFTLIIFLLISSRILAQTVTVDDNIQYQTMEGFGGFGAKKVWWETGPYYDAEYLKQTIDNLGVTIFRTQIYWDGETTNDNDDPNVINPAGFNFGPGSSNGKQFPFIKDLAAKGAKLIATVWTPPVWMKLLDEPTRIPEECYNCWQCPVGAPGREMCGGRLNPELYEEYAEYLVAYVKALKQQTGVDLYGISIQNEPFFANPFESNVVMPDEYGAILKVVGQRFKAEGLPTKFFGPEHMAEWSWGWQEQYVQHTLGNPEIKPLLDIYAVHSYVDGVAADYGSAEGWTSLHENITLAHDKPLWMTETSDFELEGFELGLSMAKSLYLALKFGHISGWVYWAMADAVIINNQLTPLGYAFKNYYRYIRPGAVRIEATSTDAGVLTIAFKHPDSNEFTLILINQTDFEKNAQLNISFSHGELSLFRTSDTESCENIGPITTNQVTLPARSISTLTTYGDGEIVSTEKKSVNRIEVYPNPVEQKLVIILPDKTTGYSYEIIDPLGRTVIKKQPAASQVEFETTSWKKGIYIIRVSKGNERIVHKVFVQ